MVNQEVPNQDYFYFTKEAIKMRKNPAKVTFNDVTYSVKVKNKITQSIETLPVLKGVSGYALPG